MGLVLLVLANSSHSEATAVVSWDRQPSELNDAVRLPVDTFAEATTKKRSRGRRARLDQYPSTQAKQRLGHAFERRKPPGKAMRAWVPADRRDEAMRIVADEVIVQKGVEPEVAIRGLVVLLQEYERQLPLLADAGRAHSTARDRSRFRSDMSSLFHEAGDHP